MKRQELRENIFKIIFSSNLGSDIDEDIEAFEFYKEDNKISSKGGEYIKEEVLGIKNNLSQIDDIIKSNLKNFSFERLSGVCRAVLRVAVYEIIYRDDIPDNVCVVEAMNLAENYEDEKAKRFVNGILGTIVRNKPEGNEQK